MRLADPFDRPAEPLRRDQHQRCSATTVDFMPKPPPTSGVMTRNFSGGIFSIATAIRSRMPLEPWVEV